MFHAQPAQGAVDRHLLIRMKEHCLIGASIYANSASIAFLAVDEHHPRFSSLSDGFNRTNLGASGLFAMHTRDWLINGWL